MHRKKNVRKNNITSYKGQERLYIREILLLLLFIIIRPNSRLIQHHGYRPNCSKPKITVEFKIHFFNIISVTEFFRWL